ncbi:hypothetical protein DFH29DRAFT_883539, partial [Suillus ampliporus]
MSRFGHLQCPWHLPDEVQTLIDHSPASTPKTKTPFYSTSINNPPPQCNVPLKRKSTAPAPRVDYQTWEHNTISTVLKVALSAELESEGYLHMTLTIDIVDRLLITRLELNAQATTKHSLADVDSSNASLRGTLKSLQ